MRLAIVAMLCLATLACPRVHDRQRPRPRRSCSDCCRSLYEPHPRFTGAELVADIGRAAGVGVRVTGDTTDLGCADPHLTHQTTSMPSSSPTPRRSRFGNTPLPRSVPRPGRSRPTARPHRGPTARLRATRMRWRTSSSCLPRRVETTTRSSRPSATWTGTSASGDACDKLPRCSAHRPGTDMGAGGRRAALPPVGYRAWVPGSRRQRGGLRRALLPSWILSFLRLDLCDSGGPRTRVGGQQSRNRDAEDP